MFVTLQPSKTTLFLWKNNTAKAIKRSYTSLFQRFEENAHRTQLPLKQGLRPNSPKVRSSTSSPTEPNFH